MRRQETVKHNTIQLLQKSKNQKPAKHWNLSSKKKNLDELQLIFSNLQTQEEVITLRLDFNSKPSLTKLVTHPIFTGLLALNLSGNNIESLQALINLQAEKLSSISLCKNQITRIDILRKARFPNISLIDFTSNQIIQVNKFTELFSKKLQRVFLTYNKVTNITRMCKIKDFFHDGIVEIGGNHLIQTFGQPVRINNKLAHRCTLKNSRMPQINYS